MRIKQENDKIVLVDSTRDSLTITWPAIPGALRYVLEYRKHKGSKEFKVLSSKLTKTQVCKKNLTGKSPTNEFFFRVGAIMGPTSENDENNKNKANGDSNDERPKKWLTHSIPFKLLEPHEFQMEAPVVMQDDEGDVHNLVISWKRSCMKDCNFQYELQMREFRDGMPWQTIATGLRGTTVKKKNLTSRNGYQFRVRPVARLVRGGCKKDDVLNSPTKSPAAKRQRNSVATTAPRERPFSPPSAPEVAKTS